MKKFTRAFSLVEVVLALGLVSFAMVGLIGLMASGYNGLHQSVKTTTESQIVQGIAAEISMLNFSSLTSGTSGTSSYQGTFPRYYDDEGQLLTNPSDYHYVVVISGTSPQMPGGLADSSNAQQIVVTIGDRSARSGKTVAQWQAAPTGNRYCIWVVNNGR